MKAFKPFTRSAIKKKNPSTTIIKKNEITFHMRDGVAGKRTEKEKLTEREREGGGGGEREGKRERK